MRTNCQWVACAVTALIFTAIPVSAKPDPVKQIDAYMRPLAAQGQFSGVVLASLHGKIVYEKAFGMASAELGVPNRVDTRFNIASITKAFTKVVTIQLILDKKLGLQDKLSKFIPDFPRGDEITVEMLLRHRSGLPHQILSDEEESLNFTLEEMVNRAKKAPLLFEPGSKSVYSSTGYTVLARVLEIASGKSYDRLLKEIVFDPAGMTGATEPDGIHFIPGRAQDYLLEADGVIPAELKNYTCLAGAGSVFSTARDVYNFDEAVVGGKLGESVKQSLVSKGIFTDNGLTNGWRANTIYDSVDGWAFVVVSNAASGANDAIIRDLPFILQGKTVSPAPIPRIAVTADVPAAYNDYLGTYDLNGSTFHVVTKAGKLYAGRYRLYPLGKDRYYSFGHWAEVKFNRDQTGSVVSSDWISPVWNINWRRTSIE